MTKIIYPDITNIQLSQSLNSLALKVLANASLTEKQMENLFVSEDVFPENDALKRFESRLNKAAEQKEKIFIFGDYDADGICSTTILVRLLKKMGIQVGYYLPNRLKEGYGITENYVHLAHEKGYDLIMTVDNGVSAFEAIEKAREYGMDFLIVDHHIIPENQKYSYLLHPDLFDDYFQQMCGAGTALQLVRYLKKDDYVDWILAMVATVGDMVPVFFANREIIKKGLKYLNTEKYLPVQCLSKKDVYDETVIGFDIVPQLNTLGRLADRANVNTLVQYFQLEDDFSILKVAAQISELNKTRQQFVKDYCSKEPAFVYEGENLLVYVDESYHDGIIGLLANRYMNSQKKAVLVFTKNEGLYKGSGRSPAGFDIYQHLLQYQEYFTAFGGHAQACGLSIDEKDFLLWINQMIQEPKVECSLIEEKVIGITQDDLSLSAVVQLDLLRPFGQGFKQPDFYIEQLPFDSTQLLKNMYRKTETIKGLDRIETLCFNSENLKAYKENCWEKIVVGVSINEFRSRKSISLNIKYTL